MNLKNGVRSAGFLSRNKEVPMRRAKKARKEVLTQERGKKTSFSLRFSGSLTVTYVHTKKLLCQELCDNNLCFNQHVYFFLKTAIFAAIHFPDKTAFSAVTRSHA